MRLRDLSTLNLFAIMGTLSLWGCGNPNQDAPAAAQAAQTAVTVSIPQNAAGMGSQAFGTNPLVISPGTTVTWVNNDTVSHTTTSDPGSAETWDSGSLSPGQNFSHTFNTPGTFPYHCSIHGAASMSGTIQVSVQASPSPAGMPMPGSSPSSSPSVSASESPGVTPSESPSPSMSMLPLPVPSSTSTPVPTTTPKKMPNQS